MHPANCPLCRKPYLYDRVKKLHVDRYEPVDDGSAFKLLLNIAMASAESATIDDMNKAANEAQEWLSSQKGENQGVVRCSSLYIMSIDSLFIPLLRLYLSSSPLCLIKWQSGML